MTMAYINIGSNQGDRKAHIDRAVALISVLAGSNLRCSDYFESKPWGYDSTSPYLNLGVHFLPPFLRKNYSTDYWRYKIPYHPNPIATRQATTSTASST